MDPVLNTVFITFWTLILDPFFNINQHKWRSANSPLRLRNGIRLDSLFWGRPGASRGPPGRLPGASGASILKDPGLFFCTFLRAIFGMI